jgi:hypothetical protein
VDLHIHYRSDRELVAEGGPLFFRVVNGVETDQAAVDRLVTVLDQLLERRPTVGMIAIIEHGTPTPTPEIRERVDTELRRYGDRIVVGYALLGLGFWATDANEFAAARAAIMDAPVFAERSVTKLASRMAAELIGLDADAVVRSCEQLRASLGLVAVSDAVSDAVTHAVTK